MKDDAQDKVNAINESIISQISTKWIIGDVHEVYGEVVGMTTTGGEPYRFLRHDGVVSLIPLDTLNSQYFGTPGDANYPKDRVAWLREDPTNP